MITIELGNIGSKEQAEKIQLALEGKSYYDFKVDYSPSAGNYPVSVSTDYPDAVESEVSSMIIFLLACSL